VKKIVVIVIILVLALSILSGCINRRSAPSENGFEKDPLLKRNWAIIPFTPQFTSINGLEVYYYVPQNAKGMIFFYHGTGGNAQSFFVHVETLYFAKEAVARGYGVVSTESKDRKGGMYVVTKNPSKNVDIKQWTDTENFLKKEGLLKSEMKRFGVGMSRGASFVSYAGAVLNYDAVAMYNAPGLPGLFSKPEYQIPTLLHMSENDQKVLNEDFLPNFNLLKDKGIRTLLLEKKAEVLMPDRFMRIPGVTLEQSEVMFDRFVTAGYVDSQGVDTGKLSSIISGDRGELVASENVIIFGGLSEEYDLHKIDFIDQIRVVLADHAFHAGYSKETLDFFEE